MSDFKNDIFELRSNIEEKLFEEGWNNVEERATSFLSDFKYKGVSILDYFSSTTMEEKHTIVEIFLNSEHKKAMEQFVIRFLNNAQIETKEELESIFAGLEYFLTDNLLKKVTIMSKTERYKKAFLSSLEVTILGSLISFLIAMGAMKIESKVILALASISSLITFVCFIIAMMTLSIYKRYLQEESNNKVILNK